MVKAQSLFPEDADEGNRVESHEIEIADAGRYLSVRRGIVKPVKDRGFGWRSQSWPLPAKKPFMRRLRLPGKTPKIGS